LIASSGNGITSNGNKDENQYCVVSRRLGVTGHLKFVTEANAEDWRLPGYCGIQKELGCPACDPQLPSGFW
jgi:hypothetical protein